MCGEESSAGTWGGGLGLHRYPSGVLEGDLGQNLVLLLALFSCLLITDITCSKFWSVPKDLSPIKPTTIASFSFLFSIS